MRLALITCANPRAINSSHPCLIGKGKHKLVTDGEIKSQLSVRCESVDRTVSYMKEMTDILEGPLVVIINIVKAAPEDARISVYAERLE